MKKQNKPKTRNWVAAHMQSSGTGFHTEKRYSRKPKHRKCDADSFLSILKRTLRNGPVLCPFQPTCQ